MIFFLAILKSCDRIMKKLLSATRLSLIIFLLFVGCGDSGKKEEVSNIGATRSNGIPVRNGRSPLQQESPPSMKEGGSCLRRQGLVIAPIKRAEDIKKIEESRQSKLNEALKEETK